MSVLRNKSGDFVLHKEQRMRLAFCGFDQHGFRYECRLQYNGNKNEIWMALHYPALCKANNFEIFVSRKKKIVCKLPGMFGHDQTRATKSQ